MASKGGVERKEGNGRRSGQGPASCLGPLPDAKQSNALLILITEMILIRTGARATLPPFRVGPHREGGGGNEEGCSLKNQYPTPSSLPLIHLLLHNLLAESHFS